MSEGRVLRIAKDQRIEPGDAAVTRFPDLGVHLLGPGEETRPVERRPEEKPPEEKPPEEPQKPRRRR